MNEENYYVQFFQLPKEEQSMWFDRYKKANNLGFTFDMLEFLIPVMKWGALAVVLAELFSPGLIASPLYFILAAGLTLIVIPATLSYSVSKFWYESKM